MVQLNSFHPQSVDPRTDWHRVHAILDMVQENNIIDSLQSTEETDILHHSDHDSESEGELQPDLDDTYIHCDKGYKCRDKSIIYKNPQTETNSMKQTNKVKKRKAVAEKHCPRPKNAWQLLFTDDLLELIVTSTNENIVRHSKTRSTTTTADEIRTLIGILYLHGIMRPTYQDYSHLWDGYCGMLCVNKAMPLERYRFLIQNLSFDTQNDDALILFDIMKRMRKAFEIFAMNCRTAFEIETVAVVDEIIVPVYGPCPFRYDIDKKPLKRGIKMVLLIDPTNFYISNLDVITDPYFGADEIVKKITQHLFESGRTIVMDSWYFSKPLMNVLKNYNLYTVAAVNPKNEKIPPLFLSLYRKTRTFMSGFLKDEVSLTSYVGSQSKSINIMTNEPKFYRRGPNINHVTAVSVYKKNQSAVEVVDVLMHYYTTMQHTNDWTLSLFFTLLNIASVNAQVIWSSRNSNVTKRRMFIRDLALGLLENEDFSLSPLSEDKLINPIPQLLCKPSYRNRKRCRICVQTTKRDRRTREYCLKCGQFICREHSVPVCTICATNN